MGIQMIVGGIPMRKILFLAMAIIFLVMIASASKINLDNYSRIEIEKYIIDTGDRKTDWLLLQNNIDLVKVKLDTNYAETNIITYIDENKIKYPIYKGKSNTSIKILGHILAEKGDTEYNNILKDIQSEHKTLDEELCLYSKIAFISFVLFVAFWAIREFYYQE